MPIATGITSRIISTLGSSSTLAPIVVKDGVVSASLTSYSYKAGGKVEGIDRATDEFGTEAIWIGGIPFFKKLIDITAYKFAKLNPGVDIRIVRDKDYAAWAKNNAKGLMSNDKKQTVLSAIEKSLEKVSKTKSLYLAKVLAATALTLISYFALTKTRQKMTKERVQKEINGNQQPQLTQEQLKANQEFLAKEANKNVAFNSVFKPFVQKQPSFKGIGQSIADGVLFNPVHNMKLIDAGITTERLAQSRNKTELAEYSIKEGFFLFFIYGSGYFIQKGFDKIAEKVFKKPIHLDIHALNSSELKDALHADKVIADIGKMPKKEAKLTEVLDFIINNPENIVVKTAKKSGVISTIKDSADVDTSKFISRKEFEAVAENLGKIDNYFKKSKEPIEKFLKKTKGLKVASVLSNLAICCFVLGFIVPEVMYKYREAKTGTKKFHVAEDIKKQEIAKA